MADTDVKLCNSHLEALEPRVLNIGLAEDTKQRGIPATPSTKCRNFLHANVTASISFSITWYLVSTAFRALEKHDTI